MCYSGGMTQTLSANLITQTPTAETPGIVWQAASGLLNLAFGTVTAGMGPLVNPFTAKGVRTGTIRAAKTSLILGGIGAAAIIGGKLLGSALLIKGAAYVAAKAMGLAVNIATPVVSSLAAPIVIPAAVIAAKAANVAAPIVASMAAPTVMAVQKAVEVGVVAKAVAPIVAAEAMNQATPIIMETGCAALNIFGRLAGGIGF